MKRNRENILRVFEQSTQSERDSGMRWYRDAHDEACKLHGDIRISSAIIAAISPGLRWERNIEAAKRILNSESLDGLGIRWYRNVTKCMDILAGNDPDIVLGGNKVRSFWKCIENPMNWIDVCVDGHAYAIWTGERVLLDETPNLARHKRYERIREDYVRVADELSMLPMQLQAITWVAYRRIHGIVKEETPQNQLALFAA